MFPLLLKIRQLNLRTTSIVVLVFVVICLAAAVKLQHDQLQMAKIVYANPKVVTIEKVVKVQGPVRIVTKIVERPSGERETTVEETRAEVVETSGSSSESSPVPLDVALKPPSGDRWLAGVGNRDFSFRSWDQYTIWAGREMGRLELLGGVGYRDRIEPQVVMLWRWGK